MSISYTIRFYLIAVLSLPAFAQVASVQLPHPQFNNASGTVCAGCSLYSYASGSTTPQATYTDSTGITPNTNPIIMGVDGGPLTSSGTSGAIWTTKSLYYKFVLIDTQGNTVFTVDNVAGGGGLNLCGSGYAIQVANSGGTALTCDPTITANPTTHSINVGTLPVAHVTIGALSAPTSWNLDTSTPASALSSMGGAGISSGLANQIAIFTATNTIGGASAIPNGTTSTTQTASDNSTKIATTAYVQAPGAIGPSSLQLAGGTAMTGNQGTGTAIQHSTGATVSGNFAKFDANGNTVDSGVPSTSAITQSSNLAGSRAGGTVYQNTSSLPMFLSGNMTTGGSGTGMVSCQDGPSSSPTAILYSLELTASVSGGPAGFACMIPPSYYYEITVTGTVGATPGNWYETTF